MLSCLALSFIPRTKSTAVRVYQVNKIGNFCRPMRKILHRSQKKAGHKAAFSEKSVQVKKRINTAPPPGATPVEAIVDASLNRMLVVAEAGSNEDGGLPATKRGAAEVVILVFNLGGPAWARTCIRGQRRRL